jgi:hypothetical protein
MKKQNWTIEEQRLLMTVHKKTETMSAIYEALPKRTNAAIHEKMARIGLSLRGRECKRL